MACAMIKNQQIATVILNQLLQDSSRSVVELEKKPAATQIQQLAFSDADFIFSTKIQISRSSTQSKILNRKLHRKNSKRFLMRIRQTSRCNGRFRGLMMDSLTQINAYVNDFVTVDNPVQIATCPRSFATRFLVEILRAVVRSLAEVIRQFPDFYTTRFHPKTLNYKNEEQVEEEEQDQFWGW
ncbi:U-box domain-containing protein 11-like [Dorcoceras hygrometricum]|uniref:U-box domain-containing protein 11-like n=1 Tax=Dorcoceras hygrometricum TaxID=472368 RepID=A0A2Z7B4W7_9LAMI|nr:U-box domain-containing protein 11-like [Dorcoceras hygrometricum]